MGLWVWITVCQMSQKSTSPDREFSECARKATRSTVRAARWSQIGFECFILTERVAQFQQESRCDCARLILARSMKLNALFRA